MKASEAKNIVKSVKDKEHEEWVLKEKQRQEAEAEFKRNIPKNVEAELKREVFPKITEQAGKGKNCYTHYTSSSKEYRDFMKVKLEEGEFKVVEGSTWYEEIHDEGWHQEAYRSYYLNITW